MDTYIKTIINGLKAWVTNCLSRLESSVSGSLATMADKLTSLSTKVQQAQSTAQSARTTARDAQSTAQSARTTARDAQSTAQSADNKAESAQNTARNADNKAESAQNTARNADNKADSSITEIRKATCSEGRFYVTVNPVVSNINGMDELITWIEAFVTNDYNSDGFFLWVARLASQVSVHAVQFYYGLASFSDPAGASKALVNQGDIIRIYKGASDSIWRAELTGINLGYEALNAAYTEGVNSL